MICTCVTFDPNDTGVRQCHEHYHIWRGAKRLTSVGSIIRASFPLDPSIPADVLANARDRGSQVDALLAAYCRNELTCIPAGTRQDAVALFEKARKWIDKQGFRKIEVQVLLGGEDHGGVLDFKFDGVPVDLKCTYNIEHTSRLQVTGYARLNGDERNGCILHVTERLKDPMFDTTRPDDWDDWATLLDHWRMVQRRTNGKG